MVPVCKMDKLGRWTLQSLLLCILWTVADALPGSPEYSSMGIHSESIAISREDKGEVLLFLINVVLHKIGKKLDTGYRCPVYCGVDHKHIYWEYHEVKKSNIPSVDGLHHDTRDSTKKQPAGSIRPIASIN